MSKFYVLSLQYFGKLFEKYFVNIQLNLADI